MTEVEFPPAVLGSRAFVTDGGIETDLIHRRGADLPDFAAFPLLDTADDRVMLRSYYDDYAAIARASGRALMLETPTWRANPDWGHRLGYSAHDLDRINRDAIRQVDAAAAPDYFLVNCAHPSHIEAALTEPGVWTSRIAGTRANASTASHAELDDAIERGDGDPADFGAAQRALLARLPHLSILGGCCGTDARHIAALMH